MDIRKIESVCAVDTFRNYSEAAYHIASSQTAISKHVAAVEEELGIRLFERATKSRAVLLTPEGEKVIGHFHEILRHYQLIRKSLEPEENGAPGVLTVSYVPRVGSFRENSIMAGFQIEQPNAIIVRKPATSLDMVDMVVGGAVDVVFLPLLEGMDTPESEFGKLNDENIEIYEIMHMSKLTIGFPENHPLAGYQEIPEREFHRLRDDVFLFSASDRDQEENLSILAKKLGIPSLPKARYADFSEQRMVLELVEAGAGLLPQMCIVPPAIGNVRFVPLAGHSGTSITLYLIYRKDNPSRMLHQFTRFVRSSSARYYRQFPYVETPSHKAK